MRHGPEFLRSPSPSRTGQGQGGNKRAVRLAGTETGEKVELPALLSSCPHCRREQVARSPVVALHVNQGRREQGVRAVVAVLYLNGPLPPGAHQGVGRRQASRPSSRSLAVGKSHQAPVALTKGGKGLLRS